MFFSSVAAHPFYEGNFQYPDLYFLRKAGNKKQFGVINKSVSAMP